MYTTEQLFEEEIHVASFHDCVEAAFDIVDEDDRPEFNDANLLFLFNWLPEDVRNIAHCWTLGDTVFRDYAFMALRDGIIPSYMRIIKGAITSEGAVLQ